MNTRINRTLRWTALAVAIVAGAGCSLVVDFDPEGKPCGANNNCLKGYTCVRRDGGREGICVSNAAADAGSAAPTGSGIVPPNAG